MDREHYKDEDYIQGILAGGKLRDDALSALFDNYIGLIYKFHKEKKLSLEQVKDVYIDSIIQIDENIRTGKFRKESKLSTYFYSIFSFKCIDISRKSSTNREESLSGLPYDPLDPYFGILQNIIQEEDHRILAKALDKLNPGCRDLLIDIYFEELSAAEIVKKSGYKNTRTVASKKFTCLSQLRNLLGGDT